MKILTNSAYFIPREKRKEGAKNKMKTRFKKGQLSIINIVFFMVLVVLVAVLTPIINSFITEYQTSNNITSSSTTGLITNAIVPLIWVGVIITFFLYVTPVRPQQY